eukprot:gene30625-35636_t
MAAAKLCIFSVSKGRNCAYLESEITPGRVALHAIAGLLGAFDYYFGPSDGYPHDLAPKSSHPSQHQLLTQRLAQQHQIMHNQAVQEHVSQHNTLNISRGNSPGVGAYNMPNNQLPVMGRMPVRGTPIDTNAAPMLPQTRNPNIASLNTSYNVNSVARYFRPANVQTSTGQVVQVQVEVTADGVPVQRHGKSVSPGLVQQTAVKPGFAGAPPNDVARMSMQQQFRRAQAMPRTVNGAPPVGNYHMNLMNSSGGQNAHISQTQANATGPSDPAHTQNGYVPVQRSTHMIMQEQGQGQVQSALMNHQGLQSDAGVKVRVQTPPGVMSVERLHQNQWTSVAPTPITMTPRYGRNAAEMQELAAMARQSIGHPQPFQATKQGPAATMAPAGAAAPNFKRAGATPATTTSVFLPRYIKETHLSAEALKIHQGISSSCSGSPTNSESSTLKTILSGQERFNTSARSSLTSGTPSQQAYGNGSGTSILSSVGVELARNGISIKAALQAGWLGTVTNADVAIICAAYKKEEDLIKHASDGLGLAQDDSFNSANSAFRLAQDGSFQAADSAFYVNRGVKHDEGQQQRFEALTSNDLIVEKFGDCSNASWPTGKGAIIPGNENLFAKVGTGANVEDSVAKVDGNCALKNCESPKEVCLSHLLVHFAAIIAD